MINLLFNFQYEVGFELLNVAFCMSALSAGDIVGRLVVHVFTDNLKLKSKTVMFTGAVLSGLARSGEFEVVVSYSLALQRFWLQFIYEKFQKLPYEKLLRKIPRTIHQSVYRNILSLQVL